MNANAFRHFYEYHFSENRHMWEAYIVPLSYEQFTQPVEYSHGSIRNQALHIMGVDEGWFLELQNLGPTAPFPEPAGDDRALIRSYWDNVEQMMRAYLSQLTDEMLSTRPIAFDEDKDLLVWQVLLHVANHATDHRAQMLRVLHDMGVKTTAQDYIFYVYDHP